MLVCHSQYRLSGVSKHHRFAVNFGYGLLTYLSGARGQELPYRVEQREDHSHSREPAELVPGTAVSTTWESGRD
jgi:hypothetical protein